MHDSSLVYQAVIVAKLTYVACAWWGFANASDRSRLESVLRRRKQVACVLLMFPPSGVFRISQREGDTRSPPSPSLS